MVRIRKIKGTTILETVVAMVIILIIFSIASTILINTTLSGVSFEKIKGRELLKLYSAKSKQEKSFFNEEIKEGEFILKREIKDDMEESQSLKIQYSVFSVSGIRLDSWQELVIP